MKKIISLIMITAMIASLVVISSADGEDGSAASNAFTPSAVNFFVSVDGDDENAGTEDAPFATIGRARDAVREYKEKNGLPEGKGGINVYITEGTYPVGSVTKFTNDDSGSEDCRISYIGLGDVTFSGGYRLDNDAFVPVTDEAVLERLADEVKDKVLEYDLTALDELGIDWGRDYEFELDNRAYPFEDILFVNSETYSIARYPNGNGNFLKIDEAVLEGEDEKYATDVYRVSLKSDDLKVLASWDLDNTCLMNGGYYIQTYLYEESPVLGIEEEDGNYYALIVHPDPPLRSRPILADGAARRIFFFNAIEALDTVGEYYIDKQAAKLYLIPCDDFENAEIVIPSCQDQAFIDMSYANYVTFDNIDFKYGWHDAIDFWGVGVEIKNSEISCLFGNGITSHGHDNLFDHCKVHDVGERGIYIGSDYFRVDHQLTDLTEVTNCEFYGWGLKDNWCKNALNIEFDGTRVANNYFHDGECGAIAIVGDSLIEYNVFTEINTITQDNGAVHSGGCETRCNRVVRYNYLYNCYSNGLYWDGFSSHDKIYGNLLVNIGNGDYTAIQGYGVVINGGFNQTVENNVFLNCYSAAVSVCTRHMWPDTNIDWNDIDRVRYVPTVKLRIPEMLFYNRLVGDTVDPDSATSPGYMVCQNNVTYSTSKSFKQYEGFNMGVARSADGPRGISDDFILSGVTFRNNTTSDVNPGFNNLDGDPLDISNMYFGDDSVIYDILPAFERIPVEKIGIDRNN